MVYLIHFNEPYKHARHYIGYASQSVAKRLKQHQNCTGARLMQVIEEAGITWQLARTWQGDRTLERRLKRWHGGAKLCPLCQQKEVL